MRVLLLILLLNLVDCALFSQEALGLKLGPYTGVETIFINPANAQYSARKFEFTLGSAHLFAHTDYAFLRSSSLASFSSDVREARVAGSREVIPESFPAPLVIFDLDGGKKMGSAHIDIGGPSLLFQLSPNFTLGAFSKLRANVSTFDIPENVGIYELNDSVLSQSIQIDRGHLAYMLWYEIGLHASARIDSWNFGLNIKHLRSTESGYIQSRNSSNNPFVDDIVRFNIPIEFSFTNDTFDADRSDLFEHFGNGSGWAFDFGASFNLNNAKLGFAILDLGQVTVQNNIDNYSFAPNEEYIIDINSYEDLTGVRNFLDTLGSDIPLVITSDSYNISLPSAVSLDFQTNLIDQYFLSANLIQRVPLHFGAISLRRDNILAITPSYETKWFSAHLPVVLYEYERLRIGASVRLGFLTIGSDHLFSTFIKSDFRGSDIYTKISLFPFGNGRRKSKRSKRKVEDCYLF